MRSASKLGGPKANAVFKKNRFLQEKILKPNKIEESELAKMALTNISTGNSRMSLM